jgi:hypothetical protein
MFYTGHRVLQKQLWLEHCDLFCVIIKFKNKNMKKFSKAIRFMLATLFVVVVSQVSVFAESNDGSASTSGLSTAQITGAFALLVLAILLPLVKRSNKAIAHK